jgi:hypothetical protein
MTPEQAERIVQLARDVSGGDEELVGRVRLAMVTPPRTTEEVGWYLDGRENDFENCFRYTVSQLEEYTTSAEDKYVYEIFEDWFGEGRPVPAPPPELVSLLPELFGAPTEDDEPPDSARAAEQAASRIKAGFDAACRAVERAFEDAGLRLLNLDTGGGDTLVFVHLPPAVADRWRDTVFGHTYESKELGVRSPMWRAFRYHLSYALGVDLE